MQAPEIDNNILLCSVAVGYFSFPTQDWKSNNVFNNGGDVAWEISVLIHATEWA